MFTTVEVKLYSYTVLIKRPHKLQVDYRETQALKPDTTVQQKAQKKCGQMPSSALGESCI